MFHFERFDHNTPNQTEFITKNTTLKLCTYFRNKKYYLDYDSYDWSLVSIKNKNTIGSKYIWRSIIMAICCY